MRTTAFELKAHPPFRLDLTVWLLRRGAANRIDVWDGSTYRRVLRLDGQTVQLAVTQQAPPEEGILRATLYCERPDGSVAAKAKEILKLLLGLEVDLAEFYAVASTDSQLGPLVERFKGVKPTRFPTLFESIANGIIFQQLSISAAISILNRFAAHYGGTFKDSPNAIHLFPGPELIAERDYDEVRLVGLTANKARALVEAARTIAQGRMGMDDIENTDNESAWAALARLRGVGKWTGDYILLRGLGRIDVFPRNDAGARAAINKWLRPGDSLSDADVTDALSRWRGFAGLVYFHLLLRGLAEKGLIHDPTN